MPPKVSKLSAIILIVSVGAITLIALAVTQVIVSNGSLTAGATMETAIPALSLTPNVDDIKLTLEASIEQTRQSALQTPWWLAATIPPSQTPGPTGTLDFSFFEHREAGAGVIVWDTVTVKGYPIGVVNQWFQNPKSIRVLAGVIATDTDQGAIAIVSPGVDFVSPEIYLAPLKAGPVEIYDAQEERLVLRAINNEILFYFDLPTRQFVSDFKITVTAPTVTPMPTFTPLPTIQLIPTPTLGLPPTSYPGATGYPIAVTSIPDAP
jgi:hypothetical protein